MTNGNKKNIIFLGLLTLYKKYMGSPNIAEACEHPANKIQNIYFVKDLCLTYLKAQKIIAYARAWRIIDNESSQNIDMKMIMDSKGE